MHMTCCALGVETDGGNAPSRGGEKFCRIDVSILEKAHRPAILCCLKQAQIKLDTTFDGHWLANVCWSARDQRAGASLGAEKLQRVGESSTQFTHRLTEGSKFLPT